MAGQRDRRSSNPPLANTKLAHYRKKRDFAKTPEPKGIPAAKKGFHYLIQKHAATRLHYDFRLELDGVLKSWAVTRGPSLDPQEKRLAVEVEDHPVSYGSFEGIIPKGQYGGGTVMLRDRRTWAPVEGKSAKDIEKGHLHFTLSGERMNGEWILIRLRPRPGEKRENWLLRKVADAHAKPDNALVESALTSVLTGRTMAEIAADRMRAGPHVGDAHAVRPVVAATDVVDLRSAAKLATADDDGALQQAETLQIADQ